MKLDICKFPDKGKKLQLFTTKIHDKANNSVIKFNAASSNGYFFRTQICKLNHKYVRIMFALLLTFEPGHTKSINPIYTGIKVRGKL